MLAGNVITYEQTDRWSPQIIYWRGKREERLRIEKTQNATFEKLKA